MRGPINTIFTGARIVDTVLFHGTGESIPRIESGDLGNPRGPVDPKSEEVTNRKTNPKMMKSRTNFFLEMVILYRKLDHLG